MADIVADKPKQADGDEGLFETVQAPGFREHAQETARQREVHAATDQTNVAVGLSDSSFLHAAGLDGSLRTDELSQARPDYIRFTHAAEDLFSDTEQFTETMQDDPFAIHTAEQFRMRYIDSIVSQLGIESFDGFISFKEGEEFGRVSLLHESGTTHSVRLAKDNIIYSVSGSEYLKDLTSMLIGEESAFSSISLHSNGDNWKLAPAVTFQPFTNFDVSVDAVLSASDTLKPFAKSVYHGIGEKSGTGRTLEIENFKLGEGNSIISRLRFFDAKGKEASLLIGTSQFAENSGTHVIGFHSKTPATLFQAPAQVESRALYINEIKEDGQDRSLMGRINVEQNRPGNSISLDIFGYLNDDTSKEDTSYGVGLTLEFRR